VNVDLRAGHVVLWINLAAAAALDREKLGGEQIAMFAEI
jgi:hypothetical protein